MENTTERKGSLLTTSHRIGASILATLAVLSAGEMLHEHMVPVAAEANMGHVATSHTLFQDEIVARAEGKGETARMPEDFDVGLQTPHIAGM